MKIRNSKYLGYLQIFLGIGAITGGLPALLESTNPSGSLLFSFGFTDNVKLQGLFWVLVCGAGHLIASSLSLKFIKITGILSVVLGLLMTACLGLQLYATGYSIFIQPLFIVLALFEIYLGSRIMIINKKF
ncbi:MAG TPA: hypothetical protein VJ909_02210 [Prolixibacteraceae bacterium]|nr:hypothetical protein [Prolixibacteraceae bacterium]